jgi:septal ring factor EnvC (AmiA/AmiB activator)
VVLASAVGLATAAFADPESGVAGLTALANYGFGGIMTAALGYALWGLYKAHTEERKTWLEKWEQHYHQLLSTLRESDTARHELAEEVRAHMKEHSELSDEVRNTLERIAKAIEGCGR